MNFKFRFLQTAFFFAAILFVQDYAQAQNDQKATYPGREIGIQLVGLDDFDFDFLYKKQIGENQYRRISLGFASLNIQGIGEDGVANFNTGLNIGKEKRKPLSDKLTFAYGTSFLFDFALTTTADNTVASISSGLGFILGVHYKLNDSFYIGAETFPSARFGFFINDGLNNFNINAGFSSRSVGVSVLYVFSKK